MKINTLDVTVTQKTRYPWSGDSSISLEVPQPTTFDLYIRIPAWTRGGSSPGGLYVSSGTGLDALKLSINGNAVEFSEHARGYIELHREWHDGDTIAFQMNMPIQRVIADEHVQADRGRVALMRGPIVYCFESIDNQGVLSDAVLPDDATITAKEQPDLLGGIVELHANGKRVDADGKETTAELIAIPYFANANRGAVVMKTWMPRTQKDIRVESK